MKRILLLMMLMCSVSAWAQDVIVKRDGTAVVCRIVNVSSLEIVYKKWTDLQGPNLVMSIADAASITYENGEKKTFDAPAANVATPTVQNTIGQQTMSDDALLKMAGKPELTPQQKYDKRAKKLKIAGWVIGCSLLSGGVAMMAVSPFANEHDYIELGYLIPGAIASACGIATTSAFLIRAHNLTKKASQYTVQSAPLYQQNFTFKNSTSLSTGIDILKDNTRHNPTLGVGLTYNF